MTFERAGFDQSAAIEEVCQEHDGRTIQSTSRRERNSGSLGQRMAGVGSPVK